MRFKKFLISFIITILVCLGINALADNFEGFWLEQELAKKPELFSADLMDKIIQAEVEQLKAERELRERFKEIDVNAKAAISIRIDKNDNKIVLFEKNSKEILAIASLTKLMTALVVFDLNETYNLFDLITINKESVNQEGFSKYKDLIAGEKLSVENLLYIMLLESSNDAAFALTIPIGEKNFVDLMNLYAKKIGLSNTFFVNPTGLEPDDPKEPKNYSTAQDLSNLAGYILREHPRIFEFTNNQNRKIINGDGSVHHIILENTNKILAEVPNIIGGKTGWTPEANGCLLIVLRDPESSDYYINVILGSEDRFTEMLKIINLIQN